MANAKTPPPPLPHHRVRTMFAAIFGFFAMTLVSASILVVWANRTLTNTNTFVQTVGPVIQRPELQDFVAGKVADQLLESTPTPDLAKALLPAEEVNTNNTGVVLRSEVRTVIHDSVVQILQSPQMQQQWQATIRDSHAGFVRELDAGGSEVTIDLGPLVTAVIGQLKQTKLAPVADKIQLSPADAKISLKGGGLERIRQYYVDLKAATVIVISLTVLFVALSVWISVHHIKTLRRMLVGTGLSALAVAAGIALSAVVKLPSSDPQAAALAGALLRTLLHGLQMGCLVLGIGCVALALGSKLYEQARTKTA